jgi:hypothetical protein
MQLANRVAERRVPLCLPCTTTPPQALRLTMVQVLMTSRGYAMNPIQSLYYVSPACLVCLLLPFGELS